MAAPWICRATGGAGGMVADVAELRRGLSLLADPDGWCQVVALPSARSSTLKGSDIDGLVAAAESMPAGFGVYFQVNPVREGLTSKAKKSDIPRRRWVYIDVDPVKDPAFKDHSAADGEKALAMEAAAAVMGHLEEVHGWPAPVVVDSGNGFGLFYRADLPADAHTQAVYRRLLGELAGKFPGVDKSVHNADRLAKLPGTWARKGDPLPDRPHRVCRVHYTPAEVAHLTGEQFAAAAGVAVGAGTNGRHPPPAPAGRFTVRATAGKGGVAYGKRALDLECARVVMARPGPTEGRNNALNRAAFSLGQLVAGGVLSESEVTARLRHAAYQAGLFDDPNCRERGVQSTIESGLRGGSAEPRAVPEKPVPGQPPNTPAADAVPAGTSVIYWASSVTPRPVEWLWPGRIPLGKLTTFAGNGGLGKTFVLCDVIARVTRGADWPDSSGGSESGKCLLISGEDDPDDTLVPRMIELGADLNRVAFLRTEVLDRFTLADLETLDRAVSQMGSVRFVAIDPPTAYLGGVNDHKNAELRGLLTPLMLWAKKHRLSVVFNTHVNKPQGAKVEAMMRVMGSVAWVNAMRSAYMFARDPEDHERRLFVGMKNNLGGEKKGLAYKIAATDTLARVEWLGEVDTTADEAVNRDHSKRKRSVQAAVWLEDLFADCSELPSKTVWDSARTTTLSDDAVKEAKEDMGIRAMQKTDDQGRRQWFWYWTPEARDAWRRRAGGSEGQSEGH